MLCCNFVLALRHASTPSQTEFMNRVDAAVDEALEMVGPTPGTGPRREDRFAGEYGGASEEILLDDVNALPVLSFGDSVDGHKSPDALTPLKRRSVDA